MRSLVHLFASLCLLSLFAPACTRQEGPFPSREIRLIVHAAPGGISDGVSRYIARELQEELRMSVIVENRTGGGLTNFGVQVIKEANRLGMVVDLSHMNREGFFQTLDVATAPLLVSHANACGMLKNPRNLDDEQIRAIAKQGGLVGILALPERVGEGEVDIEDMLKHVDYIIHLVGIEHLALGMDFVKYDGPRALKDRHHPLHKDPLIKGFEEIEDLPNLIDGLQRHGYRDEEIKLILGGNYLRVLKTILPERSVI